MTLSTVRAQLEQTVPPLHNVRLFQTKRKLVPGELVEIEMQAIVSASPAKAPFWSWWPWCDFYCWLWCNFHCWPWCYFYCWPWCVFYCWPWCVFTAGLDVNRKNDTRKIWGEIWGMWKVWLAMFWTCFLDTKNFKAMRLTLDRQRVHLGFKKNKLSKNQRV